MEKRRETALVKRGTLIMGLSNDTSPSHTATVRY